MNIAIVGSRDWTDQQAVTDYVRALPSDTTVISGGARGVDTFAFQAADARGEEKEDMNLEVIYPDWERYGKSAGYRRNADIVQAADRIVAFWDGKSAGTKHTIKLAREAGKPVEIHYPDGRIE